MKRPVDEPGLVRRVTFMAIAVAGGAIMFAAFLFLDDPQAVMVAAGGALLIVGSSFLLRARFEPAVGTNDAPDQNEHID